jgi:hypothetical protein
MTAPTPTTDKLTAWLRTVVPAGWSALIVWVFAHFHVLPPTLATWLGGLGETVAVPVVLAAVYAVLRWLEAQTWMPTWLITVLIGSVKTPSYDPPVPPTPAPAPVVPPAPPAA